ncbi:MAG: adenosylcobalamin-dependent ribonucleoside-diphosphate reductase [Candidatus Freyarchaeota archaeon]
MTGKSSISKIRKRDGRIVEFEPVKITNAIHKAFIAVKERDGETAKNLSAQVVAIIEDTFKDRIPTVEEVQDIVEKVLIKNGFSDVAKAYILYRQKRTEIREAKKLLGVSDDLKLSLNATQVLEKRYLLKDDHGNVVETPSQMFHRVARTIAAADRLYDKDADIEKTEAVFYEVMSRLEFLPNSPTLMNAGTDIGQLSACFVLPVGDSIEEIFDALKFMALIHKSGGGTGFSFSRLRPKGDFVRSTKGVASGPVSFMRIFDTATDIIKQGGRRRGANMGILRVDHPDILEGDYELINPRTGKPEKKLKAATVFNLIVASAWKTGDPGMVFLDEINRHNPTPTIGQIESTNPCGEVPLLPYESCNLGSINLSRMVKNSDVDWDKLRRVVRVAVHFLDNVIDANRYPLPQIEKITKENRKIGLGVMGFAELLIQLNIPYDSNEAIGVAEKVMSFISEEARKKSEELALERGSFPNFDVSVWKEKGYKAMRNATLTTIAPTGSISIIAGTSSGIEPLFAISFVRNVIGTQLLEVNHLFEKVAKERGFYGLELMTEIAKKGSIRDMGNIPEDVRRVFVTALDIDPEWHVRMQAAFQKHVDNAVSKTVNLPQEATIEDVSKIFWLAYKLKCKGITVFRYGSKTEQVLVLPPTPSGVPPEERYVKVDSEYAGGCPSRICPL